MSLEKLLLKSGSPASESERRKILLAGYFFLISLGVRMFFGLVNISNPRGQTDMLFLFGGVFFSVACLVALRLGWTNLSIIAHLLLSNGIAFLFTYSDPDQYQTGTYLYFIPNSLWALAIFGHPERWKGLFFAGLSFGLFLLSLLDPPRYHVADAHFFFITNFLIILLIGTLIQTYYHKQVSRSEETLQVKNKELEKINRELDRFVYSASHDLRAPLSSILGLIKLYQMSGALEKDKMVDLINNRVMKLDEIIKEIIQYSRNVRVEVLPTEIEIQKLIQSCWDTLQFMPQANSIRFINETSPSLKVIHDSGRLRIVLENFISNGIKYSKPRPEGSFLKIHAESDGNELIIDIIDNGIGISPGSQEKVFDMFYRAHDNSDGSGLGLFIVNETIQKMNGTIHLESNESKGTSFKVRIPIVTQVLIPSESATFSQ